MIELKIWKSLNIIWFPLVVIITTFDPRNFDDQLWGDIHFLLANFTTVVLFLLWWFPLWAIYKSRAKKKQANLWRGGYSSLPRRWRQFNVLLFQKRFR